MNKFIKQTLVSIMLICSLQQMFSMSAIAQDRSEEYQLKALLLSRLVSFVSWPDISAEESITLCVVGVNPFGDRLQDAFSNSNVNIEHIGNQYDMLQSCDIVFVSDSEIRDFESILDRLDGTSTLTISDIPRFATAGGMINMTFENRRVGFLINKEEADAVDVRLSFQLLSLAEIVTTRADRR